MSLFQFYLYIAASLHVSGPQAHPQESSHRCSHNHWFSVCTALAVDNIESTRPEQYRHWTNGCVNSCVNSPEDGPVGPKHVEIRQYINKIEIVTSVGFYSANTFLLFHLHTYRARFTRESTVIVIYHTIKKLCISTNSRSRSSLQLLFRETNEQNWNLQPVRGT